MSSAWTGTTDATVEQQVRTALDADDIEGLRRLLAPQQLQTLHTGRPAGILR